MINQEILPVTTKYISLEVDLSICLFCSNSDKNGE
jgi:hypothetical protein